MIPLSYEENIEFYNMVYKEEEACNICAETFCTDEDDENYKNRENIPDNIPITTHNATHFMINQLAKEFKDELDCVGENMEKYITFSVPIKTKCNDGKTIP